MDDKHERSLIPALLRNVFAPKLHTDEPFDIFCVVADDEQHFRQQVLHELGLIIAQRPDIRVGVVAADSLGELFSLAFAGNAGLPATMILLDLALEHNKYLWSIRVSEVIYWMGKLNMSFPITTTGRHIDQDVLEECFNHNPDGFHVALALRAAGFSNSIKILSNVGDEDDVFLKYHLKYIRELIPDLDIQTPIVDGFLRKQGFSGAGVIPYPTRPLLPAEIPSAGREEKG